MSQTETKLLRKTKTKTLDLSELKTVKWIAGVDAVNKTYDFSKQKYTSARQFPLMSWIMATIEMFVISIYLFIHSLPWPNWMVEIIHKIDLIIERILEAVSNKIEWLLKLPKSDKHGGKRPITLDEKISAFTGRLANWRDGITREKNVAFSQLKDILEGTVENLTESTKKQLSQMQSEMSRLIPKKADLKDYNWIINPFEFDVNELDSDNRFKNEILELQKNKKLREQFGKISLPEFWAQLQDKPVLTREVEKILSALSKIGFSGHVECNTNTGSDDESKGVSCGFSFNLHSKDK